MPDTDDEIIMNALKILDEKTDDIPGLRLQVANLRADVAASRDAQQKRAIAAALPNIAKGAVAAAAAFKQKPPDNLGGSAAILDMLAGVSAALGPEGAVFGAFLSMVSTILSFFEPQQPPLIDQIENLLRNLKAEDWRQKLAAVGDGVKRYVTVCEQYMQPAKLTDLHQHKGIQDPGGLTVEISKVNLVEGNAALTIFTAQEWLLTPANQELDEWPAILNAHCEMYTRLRLAVTQQYLYAADEKRKKTYIDDPMFESKKREAAWDALWNQIDPKYRNMAEADSNTKAFLEKIVPVARKRGLHIIHWDNADMNLINGPKAFDPPGRSDNLRGHCHRMAITTPRQGVTDPKAEYDVWVMDSWSLTLNHNTLNLQTRNLGSQSVDIGGGGVAKQFFDWWPVPKPGSGNKFWIYFAVDTSTWGSNAGGILQLYEWDKDANTFTRVTSGAVDWQYSADQWMMQVRVATLAAPFPDDPDKDAVPQNLIGTQIVYCTLLNSRNIFVWVNNDRHYVPIPMRAYTGIAVDRNFLWMYGIDGLACTTHASVLNYLKGAIPDMPRWLGTGRGRIIGPVQDLSPCEDGTLFALLPDRGVTAPYHVEFSVLGAEPIIDEDWTTLPAVGGGAVQCQKLPIFGWARVQGLATLLSQQKSK